MKINWLSNAPWAATGYGNQTKLFLPRFKELGHEVACTAFYGLEGAILNWNGIPVLPRGHDMYGADIADSHTRYFGAEVCFSLMDAWVNKPDAFITGVKWIPWFPVDMEPLPPPIGRNIAKAYKRIIFSKFAEKQLHDAGFDCYYVPHGIDTNTFRPIDRAQARESIKWPNDRFIYGMIAANKGNPSRKAFTQILDAFAEVVKKHDDVLLYMHTSRGEQGEFGGVNLPEYIAYKGLEKHVLFCNQYQYLLSFEDQYMNAAYNAMDAHVLVSFGEGFGIPIVEAQSAGCPVIVGDWTSMSELCFSGWKVPKSEADPWWTPLAAYQFVPRSAAITDAMLQAYRMAGNNDYRKAARKGALRYDADKVTQRYWKPVLEDIEAHLDADRGLSAELAKIAQADNDKFLKSEATRQAQAEQ